jgi:hypothetical protein
MRTTRFASLVVTASLASSLAACGDDPMTVVDPPARGAPVALPMLERGEGFASAQIGAEVTVNDALLKEITPVHSGDARLVVGRAFVTRASVDAENVATFVHVTNQGPTRLCYVHAEALAYQGAHGAMLKAQAAVAYLLGSVGEKDGLATDTCLAPGESAYVVDVSAITFDAVEALAFRLEAQAEDYRDPVSSVEPESIDASPAAITLDATNAGPGRAEVTSIGGTYIAFDSMNRPLTVGLLGSCTPGAARQLAPGARRAMCADAPSYDGHTEMLEARISFADLPTGPTRVGGPGGADKRAPEVAAWRARLGGATR